MTHYILYIIIILLVITFIIILRNSDQTNTVLSSDNKFYSSALSLNGKYQSITEILSDSTTVWSTFNSKKFNTQSIYDTNIYLFGITNDGSFQIAMSYDSYTVYVYQTGNWTELINTQLPVSVTNYISLSVDASYLTIVGKSNDSIFTSINKGLTWISSNAPRGTWIYNTMTPNGKYQTSFLSVSTTPTIKTGIYMSTDYGMSWKLVLSLRRCNYAYSCISESGKYQVAIIGKYTSLTSPYVYKDDNLLVTPFYNGDRISYGQDIYTSSDYGTTWTKINIPIFIIEGYEATITDWVSVSCSPSGKNVIACSFMGGLYGSDDYGKTWTQIIRGSPSNGTWNSCNYSSNGSLIVTSNDIYVTIPKKNYLFYYILIFILVLIFVILLIK